MSIDTPDYEKVKRAQAARDNRYPYLIIPSTGSAGSPKAAFLNHETILVQNLGLALGFGLTRDDVMNGTRRPMSTLIRQSSFFATRYFNDSKTMDRSAKSA